MIESCFPTDGSGFAVALRAYVDASQQGSVFSVAGFAFGLDRAKKAQREWRTLHGDRVLHMTDLHARRGDFRNLSPESAGEILKSSVSIISKYKSYGMAASCDINEMDGRFVTMKTGDHFADTISAGMNSPYAWCCHAVMHHFGRVVRHFGGKINEINYIFECGDEGQGRLKEYVRFIEDMKYPGLRQSYAMNTAVFAEKTGKEILLQSADIFCWEWARHIQRKRENKPLRPSLNAIFGGISEESQQLGVTASSDDPFKVVASHYEGNEWIEGFERVKAGILRELTPDHAVREG